MSESVHACIEWLALTGTLCAGTFGLICFIDLCCRRGSLASLTQNPMYKIPTTRAELMARLIQIFVEQLGVDEPQVQPGATMDELGADSLDAVELIMAFEEEFNIEIPGSDAEDLDPKNDGSPTVQALADYLATRLSLPA